MPAGSPTVNPGSPKWGVRPPLSLGDGHPGSGFRAELLDKALSLGPRMIGCDAGTTDSGPTPLTTGTRMFSKAAVKRVTGIMMTRAVKAGIPLEARAAPTAGDEGADPLFRAER